MLIIETKKSGDVTINDEKYSFFTVAGDVPHVQPGSTAKSACQGTFFVARATDGDNRAICADRIKK